jgi:MFS family permease
MNADRARRAAVAVGARTRRAAAAIRRWTHAGGGGQSGLGPMVELHGVNSAADALFAVALAGTLFFQVPTDQARGRVALYLLVTMAPFAVVAPLVGPVLDRFRHGRRTALSLTFVIRAVLAFEVARTLGTREAFALYPAAFGVLVLSRAYGVSRSAVMPRLRPRGFTLVQANARLSLAGLVMAAVAGPVGIGLTATLGSTWTLGAAAVVYLLGAALSLRLSHRVDSEPVEPASEADGAEPQDRVRARSRRFPPTVTGVLRSAAALRMLSGFLVFFVAFLVRQHPVGGLRGTVAIGVLAGCVAAGGVAGTALGSRLSRGHPESISTASVLAALLASAFAAWRFGLASAVVLALVAAAGQSLSKLSLDAVIQRDVDEGIRTSTFGRVEALLQLIWVAGAGIGLALPLRGNWGMTIAAAGLVVSLVAAVRFQQSERHRRRRAVAGASGRPHAAAR